MNSNGNVFVYILIAVVLLGALIFALSDGSEGDNTELDEGRVTIAANEIMSYSSSAKSAILNLERLGTSANQIDFILPSDPTPFNTAPHLDKLFHPEGGGLNYKPLPVDAIDRTLTGTPLAAYYVGRFANIEWTPTTADDVIFTAYGLTRGVCEQLNMKVHGDITIPTVTGLAGHFVDVEYHSGSNSDFEESDCSTCEEKSALCVTDGTTYVFYNTLVAQ